MLTVHAGGVLLVGHDTDPRSPHFLPMTSSGSFQDRVVSSTRHVSCLVPHCRPNFRVPSVILSPGVDLPANVSGVTRGQAAFPFRRESDVRVFGHPGMVAVHLEGNQPTLLSVTAGRPGPKG